MLSASQKSLAPKISPLLPEGPSKIPELEPSFTKGDFDRITAKIANHDDRTFFKKCYRGVDNGRDTSYKLVNTLAGKNRWRLWDIYCQANPNILIWVYFEEIVAFNFYCYRQQMERIGDRLDDLSKARYLNYLIEYLRQKRTRKIPPLENGDGMKEMMDMVYNIYDRAYFHRKEHSGCSDLECFAEAERYYCVEKALDYFAFLEYLNREKNGLVGDENSDYEAAKKHYEAWGKNMGTGINYRCASAC